MMYGYPGYGFGGSWIGMLLMMGFGLLLLVGFVLLIVWIVREASGSGRHTDQRTRGQGIADACDIARVRYARGEITKEQFEEICRTIGV